MKHQGTKIIETKRLLLRPFVLQDAESMFLNWASDDEVTKYLVWPTHESMEVTKNVLTDWIENYSRKSFYQWAITRKENAGNPIGCIGVNNEIQETIKMAHIGYCLGRAWWHSGMTSEALEGVIRFLFDAVGVNRIESRHDPRNPNSGAVMRKCGMKPEGFLRQSDWNNQGLCDASYYALLAAERE